MRGNGRGCVTAGEGVSNLHIPSLTHSPPLPHPHSLTHSTHHPPSPPVRAAHAPPHHHPPCPSHFNSLTPTPSPRCTCYPSLSHTLIPHSLPHSLPHSHPHPLTHSPTPVHPQSVLHMLPDGCLGVDIVHSAAALLSQRNAALKLESCWVGSAVADGESEGAAEGAGVGAGGNGRGDAGGDGTAVAA